MAASDKEIICVIGLMLVVVAVNFYLCTRRFLKTAVVTKGEIIGYGEAEGSTAGNRTLTAVICFLASGRKYKISARIIGKRNNPLGREVEVLYDPKYPVHAYMKGASYLYFYEAVCAIVGTCMLIVAYAAY